MNSGSCDTPVRIVGLGGTLRAGSSTERVIRTVLRHAGEMGAQTTMLPGPSLDFPMYEPGNVAQAPAVLFFIDTLRAADAVVIGSPGYHGGISGLIKNALDYTEEMSRDPSAYFDGKCVGCVATGSGWQGANAALGALRNVVHALRGWPTPLGIAANSQTPLFGKEGDCRDLALASQCRTMASQLIDFARGRRALAAENASEPHLVSTT